MHSGESKNETEQLEVEQHFDGCFNEYKQFPTNHLISSQTPELKVLVGNIYANSHARQNIFLHDFSDEDYHQYFDSAPNKINRLRIHALGLENISQETIEKIFLATQGKDRQQYALAALILSKIDDAAMACIYSFVILLTIQGHPLQVKFCSSIHPKWSEIFARLPNQLSNALILQYSLLLRGRIQDRQRYTEQDGRRANEIKAMKAYISQLSETTANTVHENTRLQMQMNDVQAGAQEAIAKKQQEVDALSSNEMKKQQEFASLKESLASQKKSSQLEIETLRVDFDRQEKSNQLEVETLRVDFARQMKNKQRIINRLKNNSAIREAELLEEISNLKTSLASQKTQSEEEQAALARQGEEKQQELNTLKTLLVTRQVEQLQETDNLKASAAAELAALQNEVVQLKKTLEDLSTPYPALFTAHAIRKRREPDYLEIVGAKTEKAEAEEADNSSRKKRRVTFVDDGAEIEEQEISTDESPEEEVSVSSSSPSESKSEPADEAVCSLIQIKQHINHPTAFREKLEQSLLTLLSHRVAGHESNLAAYVEEQIAVGERIVSEGRPFHGLGNTVEGFFHYLAVTICNLPRAPHAHPDYGYKREVLLQTLANMLVTICELNKQFTNISLRLNTTNSELFIQNLQQKIEKLERRLAHTASKVDSGKSHSKKLRDEISELKAKLTAKEQDRSLLNTTLNKTLSTTQNLLTQYVQTNEQLKITNERLMALNSNFFTQVELLKKFLFEDTNSMLSPMARSIISRTCFVFTPATQITQTRQTMFHNPGTQSSSSLSTTQTFTTFDPAASSTEIVRRYNPLTATPQTFVTYGPTESTLTRPN